jgi:hypothetical protein
MTASKRHSGFFKVVNLSEMVGCLEDLITYFAQPEEELSELEILSVFSSIIQECTVKLMHNDHHWEPKNVSAV